MRWAAAAVAVTALAVSFPLGSSSLRAGGFSWAGTWKTSYGPMELRDSGSGIEGEYTTSCTEGEGTIIGRYTSPTRLTVRGTWSQVDACNQRSNHGQVEFTLSTDRRAFSGKWSYGDTTDWESEGWNGTCEGGRCLRNVPERCTGGGREVRIRITVGHRGVPVKAAKWWKGSTTSGGIVGMMCEGGARPGRLVEAGGGFEHEDTFDPLAPERSSELRLVPAAIGGSYGSVDATPVLFLKATSSSDRLCKRGSRAQLTLAGVGGARRALGFDCGAHEHRFTHGGRVVVRFTVKKG
jgi:hypothetical protein